MCARVYTAAASTLTRLQPVAVLFDQTKILAATTPAPTTTNTGDNDIVRPPVASEPKNRGSVTAVPKKTAAAAAVDAAASGTHKPRVVAQKQPVEMPLPRKRPRAIQKKPRNHKEDDENDDSEDCLLNDDDDEEDEDEDVAKDDDYEDAGHSSEDEEGDGIGENSNGGRGEEECGDDEEYREADEAIEEDDEEQQQQPEEDVEDEERGVSQEDVISKHLPTTFKHDHLNGVNVNNHSFDMLHCSIGAANKIYMTGRGWMDMSFIVCKLPPRESAAPHHTWITPKLDANPQVAYNLANFDAVSHLGVILPHAAGDNRILLRVGDFVQYPRETEEMPLYSMITAIISRRRSKKSYVVLTRLKSLRTDRNQITGLNNITCKFGVVRVAALSTERLTILAQANLGTQMRKVRPVFYTQAIQGNPIPAGCPFVFYDCGVAVYNHHSGQYSLDRVDGGKQSCMFYAAARAYESKPVQFFVKPCSPRKESAASVRSRGAATGRFPAAGPKKRKSSVPEPLDSKKRKETQQQQQQQRPRQGQQKPVPSTRPGKCPRRLQDSPLPPLPPPSPAPTSMLPAAELRSPQMQTQSQHPVVSASVSSVRRGIMANILAHVESAMPFAKILCEVTAAMTQSSHRGDDMEIVAMLDKLHQLTSPV